MLTEAAIPLNRAGMYAGPLFALVESRVIPAGMEIGDQVTDLRVLTRRHRVLSMPLADAGLVRRAGVHFTSTIFTRVGDFLFYREHGYELVPGLTPGT